jgi:Double zinc ribbon
MRCPRCQHENASSMKFCGECGVKLAAVCSACGTANGPAQKFCGECGATLGAGASPTKPPTRADSKRFEKPAGSGYIERRSVAIDPRYAKAESELPGFASELVRLGMDVIVTGGSASIPPAMRATNTIPGRRILAGRHDIRRSNVRDVPANRAARPCGPGAARTPAPRRPDGRPVCARRLTCSSEEFGCGWLSIGAMPVACLFVESEHGSPPRASRDCGRGEFDGRHLPSRATSRDHCA